MVEFDDGMTDTRPPDGTIVQTDVVVVGSGPAGASAALFLSTLGVDNIMITKYRWTANTPRAHITNQRTMEIFRDLGVEDQVLAEATPHELMGDTVFCTSIAGEEIGRILTWGTHPAREGDYRLASPCLNCDIPQTYLEPILVQQRDRAGHPDPVLHRVPLARRRTPTASPSRCATASPGSSTRSGPTTSSARTAPAPPSPRTSTCRCEGQMDVAGSMNITFKADLSELVGHRPSVLYWVIQPGADVGGIGAGLVRMVRPWNEWLIVWGYDIGQPPPQVDDALRHADRAQPRRRARPRRRDHRHVAVGQQRAVRDEPAAGPGVLRRRRRAQAPAENGLGSNTSIQDSYNLAWKLAAVLRGQAGPELLDTYTAERAPVAEQIVTRANSPAASSAGSSPRSASARTETEEQMRAAIDGGRQHAGRPAQAGRAARGDGAEELRVQRARHRARPALRVGRGGRRRQHAAGADPRPGALLPAHHDARCPAAARVGRRRPPQAVHPRPRAVRAVHAC